MGSFGGLGWFSAEQTFSLNAEKDRKAVYSPSGAVDFREPKGSKIVMNLGAEWMGYMLAEHMFA